MPNALPFLLLGGAAIMMMGGKKKKKPTEENEEEVVEEIPTATLLSEETMLMRCNKFINAVWTEPSPGEAAIKEIVVKQDILPEMVAAAKQKRKEKGDKLSQDFSHTLVMIGLNAIAPNCGWVLTGDGWRYANGNVFEGKVLDVYNSMREIALEVIKSVNNPSSETLTIGGEPPPPKPEEPGGLKFDIGG